ncbi:heterokaryon incompatibility protein-domain-containing protein [Lasiosphaeria ovina]|uniref:Heterokaryon incompatibility protein-domain-containing protein n=1 Tax=Lasiosphaeria ovina TaxID=92902 RepID=A0AAE0N817_9PEZI|nr:heterokaryon incompatibility protein-domain-containing protein [Lasiosphaeria ovina]
MTSPATKASDGGLDYKYKPLPSRGSFRAIELKGLDCSGFWPYTKETLHIRIVTIGLDERGPADGVGSSSSSSSRRYEALSYAWGAKTGRRHRVVIETEYGEERVKSINENLFLALTAIWKNKISSVSSECRLPLFADQICVNQENEVEVAAQVRLMGRIYHQAAGVIVWLGPSSRGSDGFFDFADTLCRRQDGVACETAQLDPDRRGKIHTAVVDWCEHRAALGAEQQSGTQQQQQAKVSSPDGDDGDDENDQGVVKRFCAVTEEDCLRFPVTGYAEVLRRPWFGRLWIIQEAALAPVGVFLCGNRMLSFDFFRATFLFYCLCSRTRGLLASVKQPQLKLPMNELVLQNDVFEFARPYLSIGKERAAIQGVFGLSRETSLVALVKKYNVNGDNDKVGASQPKDRVFGLLGLLKDPGLFDYLDYGDAAKAYIGLVRHEVKHDVDILLFAQKEMDKKKGVKEKAENEDTSLETLPSWVPDWSIGRLRIPHGYASLTDGPRYAASRDYAVLSPVGDKPAVIRGSTLRIRGVVVDDRILKVGETQIRRDADRFLDYAALKRYFDETDLFLEDAATVRRDSLTSEQRLQTALRLTDGGRTLDRKDNSLDDLPLEALYNELQKTGTINVRAEQARETYTSFSNIWRLHSPGAYESSWLAAFLPAPALTSLRYILFPLDVIGVALSLAWVRLYLIVLAFRQQRVTVALPTGRGNDKTTSTGQQEMIRDLDMQLVNHWSMTEYKENIARNRGRRLYLTREGRVGLAPQDVEQGDMVVVLFGGSVPFIVRKDKEDDGHGDKGVCSDEVALPLGKVMRCRLVGEAYCPGVMNGEALVGTGEDDTVTFLIS